MRVFLLLFLGLAAASCGPSRHDVPNSRASTNVPAFGDTDPHEWDALSPWLYPIHGIDVSKYQGDIDWQRVRASGTSFAFIKATEGGDVADERFLDNWHGAARAGLPRGAYHYYYFCRTAAEQADWFMTHVPRDRAALPAVLDMEWTHKSRTCTKRPPPETVRAEMAVYLDRVARHYGKRPIVYTTVDFYHENDLGQMRGTDFWLRSVAGHPSAIYPNQKWAFWQYTGTGVVPGIAGNTDINVFAGTRPQWSQWLSANAR